jgi:HEAT repeat protein
MTRFALAFTLAVASTTFAAPGVDDAAFTAAATWKTGDKRTSFDAISDAVTAASKDPQSPQAKQLATKLAGLITAPSATLEAKDFACRQLWLIGSAEQVPLLAKLLADPQLTHMARYALLHINDPSVDAAFREALTKLDGPALVGVINSIGERRDAAAVPALQKLVFSPRNTAAVIDALGKIGSIDAVNALQTHRSNAPADQKALDSAALLVAAERNAVDGRAEFAASIYTQLLSAADSPQVARAALTGLACLTGDRAVTPLAQALQTQPPLQATALRLLENIRTTEATAAIVLGLSSSDPAIKVIALDALGNRGDRAAAKAVIELTKSPDANVRAAALRSTGKLADRSAVPLLVTGLAAAEAPVRDAAKEALTLMTADGTNRALFDAACAATDEKLQIDLIKLLPARRAVDQVDVLINFVEDVHRPATARRFAATAVGDLATPLHLPAVLKLLASEKDEAVRDSLESAAASIVLHAKNPAEPTKQIVDAHASATGEYRASLLRTLAKLPGASSLSAIRGDLTHADAKIADAAVRALASSTDPAATDDLVQIIKSTSNETHRILALRGYIRLIGQATEKPAAQQVALHESALALCSRPDEKRLVLASLANIPDPAALKLAESLESDPKLKNEAAAARKKIQQALDKKK